MFNCITPSIDDLECNKPYANLNDTKVIFEEICSSIGSCVYQYNTELTEQEILADIENDNCESVSVYTPDKRYFGNTENVFEICNYNDKTIHIELTSSLVAINGQNGRSVDITAAIGNIYLPTGGFNSVFSSVTDNGIRGYPIIESGIYLLSANYRNMVFPATWDFPTRAVIGFSNSADTADYIENSPYFKEFPTTNLATGTNVCGAPRFNPNNDLSISAIVNMEVGEVFGFGITNVDLLTCGTLPSGVEFGIGSSFTITKLE
jgi:hypothetical protein